MYFGGTVMLLSGVGTLYDYLKYGNHYGKPGFMYTGNEVLTIAVLSLLASLMMLACAARVSYKIRKSNNQGKAPPETSHD